MESQPAERVERVSNRELRRLFEALGYADLVASGALSESVTFDSHPTPNKANEPVCTRSQLLAYRDSGDRVVVRIHRYLRPDGTIGASGRPDPKFLLHDSVIYKQAEP
jgi:hypothetical protein